MMTNSLSTIRFKARFNYFTILFIFICSILNSCQRDVDTPELSKKATQLEIQEVKEWYNTFTFGKAQKATIFKNKFKQSLKTSDSEIIPELILDWSHAVVVKSGERIIVEDHPNDMNATHQSDFIESFVQRIAQTLRAYGDSKGYTFPTTLAKDQFYQHMAWGGLQETQRFKDLSPAIQNAIKNTLMIEQYGENLLGNHVSQKGTKPQCP